MATNKLNEFIAQVKQGLARSNHFEVEIFPPSALRTLTPVNENIEMILMYCDQAQLPGISFNTAQVRSYGEFKEIPYEKTFEPLQLSFYVDKKLIVKEFWDEWMALIQSPTTRDFNYPKQYTANAINVILMDTADNNKYKYTLHNAYPKAISSVQLDYSAHDIMKVQVSIAYQYATMARLETILGGDTGNDIYQPIMASYDYGYTTLTEIPINYFTDFNGFQAQYTDFTSGVKSLTTYENTGEETGFGGIFI